MEPLLQLTRREYRQVKRLMENDYSECVVRRAHIILLAADGTGDQQAIGREAGARLYTVALWLRRFQAEGVSCLTKNIQGLKRPPVSEAKKEEIRVGLRKRRKGKGRQKSLRALAGQLGVSHMTVWRVSRRRIKRTRRK
jgi:hypothetical protein